MPTARLTAALELGSPKDGLTLSGRDSAGLAGCRCDTHQRLVCTHDCRAVEWERECMCSCTTEDSCGISMRLNEYAEATQASQGNMPLLAWHLVLMIMLSAVGNVAVT